VEANLALKTTDRKIGVTPVLLALIVLFLPSSGFGSVIRLAITPPAIHAGEDLSFLEKGFVDMLAGRVAIAGKSEAVTIESENRTLDLSSAVEKAKTLKADYVVLASITVLGGSVSTDARVLDTATGKIALTFSQTGKDQADIITHIDQLAGRINAALLGRPPASTTPAGVPKLAPPAVVQGDDRGDVHQHPEKLLRGLDSDAQQVSPPQYETAAPAAAIRLITRTRRMDRQIRGVTAGDIDGDGANEIICIDSTTVLVYGITEGRAVKMAELDAGVANIAVEAADLNGNGRWELFITHSDGDKLRSYVLEWGQAGLSRIAGNLRWYFRTIASADRGRVLIGQRKGMDRLFLPGIFEIGYVEGRYDEVRKLDLPGSRNIFGFTQGAVRSPEQVDIIEYSRDHYLRISDPKGREEWTSVESYGGSANLLVTKSKPDEPEMRYLPSRVDVADMDGDGLKEIVAVKNEDRAGSFSRLRMFKQGRLEVLKWDQVGLAPVGQTPSVAKFIGDFALGDINGDGRPEIIAAVVQKTRNVAGPGSSYLAVFSLDKPAAAGRP
jgi:hypothetical protein